MAKRAISGPAAAIIFLAVGAAVLLSTSYISDIFGSASFQKKIASKLMISRPYQIGAEVMSLIDSAFDEAASSASIQAGTMGAGRAVWYCNAPQPPSVSEVKAALCTRTHSIASDLIESRVSPYNYTVTMPDCIYLNITGPESFTMYTQGEQVTGAGVSSIGSTSVDVNNRFWYVYQRMKDWVDNDMGNLFSNLCAKASKACQVRFCSCDPTVITDGMDEIFSHAGLTEADVKDAVDQSLSVLASHMDSNVTCTSTLNVVTGNKPNYTISTRVGCNCDMNLPPRCTNVPTYLDDPTGTAQSNDCNATAPCERCLDEECASILPTYGCSAPFRMDVTTQGDRSLSVLAQRMGLHRAHAISLDVSAFSSNVLLSDYHFKDYELPTLVNFANARLALVDNATYAMVRSAASESTFNSKGFSTTYTRLGGGAVASLYQGWKELTDADTSLLAAHYYDLGAQLLYPKVDFNCTGVLPQALATVITEYPQNGTELLLGMEQKAYVYGTVQCEDKKYPLDGRDLVLDLDFWVSIDKQCQMPSQCNGTSANCQSALTLPLPSSTGSCPNCFQHADAPGVTITRTENGGMKCKHFSGSRAICEFQYDSQSVLKDIASQDRIFSVPCTCYLNGIESECTSVVNLNYTDTVRPEVRCPVATQSNTFYSDYLGVRNCGTIQDRFGFNVTGQVCDIACYNNAGEVKCGDCAPDFTDQCGCGACALEVNRDAYQYSGNQKLYWLGGDHVYFSNGTLGYSQKPGVTARLSSSTCTSVSPKVACNAIEPSNTTRSLFGGLSGSDLSIELYTCLTPVTLRSGGTFIDVCDCETKASDPLLRTDAARYRPDYLSKLSKDAGFTACCEVCSMARLCAVEDNPRCAYQGKSCRELLVETGGNPTDSKWPDFLSCCKDQCLSSCTRCVCPDSNSPFCANPSCGLVWENSCYPAVIDPAHSTCLSYSCLGIPSSATLLSKNFDPTLPLSAISCTAFSPSPGCGAAGECGTCTPRMLPEVTGRQSSFSNMTGFCSLAAAPTLSQSCYNEIKTGGKHLACVEVSCSYPTGTYVCGTKPAGSPCSTGVSGDICSQCTGDGLCGVNATADGSYCLPVVHNETMGLVSSWDYSTHQEGCCCTDELCTQKQQCSGSNGLCDLDCVGFDPDCQVVSDVARGCPTCNLCSGPLCVANTGEACGQNCTVSTRTVSGVQIGTCVC